MTVLLSEKQDVVDGLITKIKKNAEKEENKTASEDVNEHRPFSSRKSARSGGGSEAGVTDDSYLSSGDSINE